MSENNLPSARSSPRIVNGVLKWYEGDTFDLQLEITLQDQDDLPVTLKTTDVVDIVFMNAKNKIVKELSFTKISNGLITLSFDEALSALFKAGEYTYDVYLTSGTNRTTLAKDNMIVVE